MHGLGRLGVSNAIWDKAGPLGAGEWERIRMHPYLTERILCQSPALAPLGAIAVQHRERLDGSGYPRGLRGSAITHPGPHPGRGRRLPARCASPDRTATALAADEAAAELRTDAARAGSTPTRSRRCSVPPATVRRAGASGPPGSRPRDRGAAPRGPGLSSKEIADALVISPKTVRNHIEHIYAKIGAGNRVAASLFAVQNGLLPAE